MPATKALVDSGADISLFDIEILQYIGIDIRNYPRRQSVGAGGIPLIVWEFPIEVRFPELSNRKFRLQAHWRSMRDPKTKRKTGLNLLGRQDFFKYFRVTYDERQKEMEFLPYPMKK